LLAQDRNPLARIPIAHRPLKAAASRPQRSIPHQISTFADKGGVPCLTESLQARLPPEDGPERRRRVGTVIPL
jgi:hypothetical protein